MNRRIIVGGLGAAVAIEILPGDLGTQADADFATQLTSLWSRCLTEAEPTSTVTARLGATHTDVRVSGTDPGIVSTSLTQQVTHELIAARRGELLMFHAGAVADLDTGHSLVYIAKGGTGKTTLTTTLARHAGYLSDETVGIQPDGTILPYPKPLSVRGNEAFKRETGPDDLGLQHPAATPRVARLVLLNRDPEADGATVEALGTIDAIVALSSETSSLSHMPRALHRLAELLTATGGAERWTYAEHADLLPLAHRALGWS